MKTSFSRRQFLRAAGSLIALPALESLNFKAFSSPALPAPVKRMIFLGMGFGVTQETWFPDTNCTGRDYPLTEGLSPLQRHRENFSIIQGLTNRFTMDAHWGSSFWLTGANRFAEPGQSFHNTISVDQVAAAAIGKENRFQSLALNSSEKGLDGNNLGHGPGLSLSWNASGKPVAGSNSPLELFHRLFSDDNTPLEKRKAMLQQNRSVLDAVLSDAKSMQRGLSKNDNGKLDEYFTSIRDMESRIGREEAWMHVPKPKPPLAEPPANPDGREEIRLMYELMAAAFQADSTRVFSYRLPVETLVKSIGLKLAAHDISHYSPGERMEASRQRDRTHSELLAGLLDKLAATREPDGSRLLDHSTVVFGSNLRTVHQLDNCPTLVAGGGAKIRMGEHIVLPKNTPLCNLWLTLLKNAGAPVEKHGDSTGTLQELTA